MSQPLTSISRFSAGVVFSASFVAAKLVSHSDFSSESERPLRASASRAFQSSVKFWPPVPSGFARNGTSMSFERPSRTSCRSPAALFAQNAMWPSRSLTDHSSTTPGSSSSWSESESTASRSACHSVSSLRSISALSTGLMLGTTTGRPEGLQLRPRCSRPRSRQAPLQRQQPALRAAVDQAVSDANDQPAQDTFIDLRLDDNVAARDLAKALLDRPPILPCKRNGTRHRRVRDAFGLVDQLLERLGYVRAQRCAPAAQKQTRQVQHQRVRAGEGALDEPELLCRRHAGALEQRFRLLVAEERAHSGQAGRPHLLLAVLPRQQVRGLRVALGGDIANHEGERLPLSPAEGASARTSSMSLRCLSLSSSSLITRPAALIVRSANSRRMPAIAPRSEERRVG